MLFLYFFFGILLISFIVFLRFNDPAEAAELRKGEKAHNLSRLSLLSWSTPDLAASMENLPEDLDRSEFESQRLSLVKEKEILEKEQEEFEKRRKSLEEAQAKLEAEKLEMEKEHAAQVGKNLLIK